MECYSNIEGILKCGFNEVSIGTVKWRILDVHPELKYLLNKMFTENNDAYDKNNQFNHSKLFNIIRQYWKHPEIETLCQLGCYELALDNRLFSLSKTKMKQVLRCVQEMQKNGTLYDISLTDIFKYFKYYKEMSFTEWYAWWCWNDHNSKYAYTYTIEEYRYCVRKNISKYEYRDYLNMAHKVGHDIEDPYWKYPNNFHKFHDKVMDQIKALEVAKYGVQQDFLKEILKPMLQFNANVDGYDIFLSTDATEWQKTCDTLYQCLLRNGYMKNVIMQQDIIVFVWKDGVPIATAQLDYDKKIGQFYGDERGHATGDSCKPSEEVETAFNKWLETFKPKKANFKFGYKEDIKYYKGFTELVEGGFHTDFGKMDGVGKGSTFLIGHVYDTDFDDETIISTGANCVATNKVFHFCNSITEISRHYCPKYYAEIKPLGPIVENNGALLSNRIEIVRMIPDNEIKEILALEAANYNKAQAII